RLWGRSCYDSPRSFFDTRRGRRNRRRTRGFLHTGSFLRARSILRTAQPFDRGARKVGGIAAVWSSRGFGRLGGIGGLGLRGSLGVGRFGRLGVRLHFRRLLGRTVLHHRTLGDTLGLDAGLGDGGRLGRSRLGGDLLRRGRRNR